MARDEAGHPTSVQIVLGLAGAVACGAAIALQARINGQLGRELDDGYLAALISFGSGLVVMLVVLAFSKRGRRGLRVVGRGLQDRSIPWWMVVGGSVGALFVLSQGIAASLLGIAVFTVAVVAGQTIGGLLIDRRGLAGIVPRPVTLPRFVGSMVMLGAVALVVSSQLVSGIPLWLTALPLAAGLGIGWQQAVNGRIRVISGSPVTATILNFTVGAVLLAVASAVHIAFAGLPATYPRNLVLYSGGMIGILFIMLSAVLAPRIGVLLLSLGTISGQLIAALLIDVIAPTAGHPFGWTSAAGTALALVALGIAAGSRLPSS